MKIIAEDGTIILSDRIESIQFVKGEKGYEGGVSSQGHVTAIIPPREEIPEHWLVTLISGTKHRVTATEEIAKLQALE